MPLLTVVGSITTPPGKTLAWATLEVQLLEEYADGDARYPREYLLEYDLTNGAWKPNGTADGTAAEIPGADVGGPAPAAQLREVQHYADNSEQSRSWTQGLVATSAGEWDYTAEPPERWAMGGNYGATLYPAATGRLLRYGAGAPSSSLGVVGDFYIDTAHSRLYGPKTSTGWDGYTVIGGTGSLFEYTHTQNTAATTWTINHNLGIKPTVQLLNTGSQVIEGDLVHTNSNQAIAYFSTPVAGLARCVGGIGTAPGAGTGGLFDGTETVITALANDDYLFLTDTSDSDNPKRITVANAASSGLQGPQGPTGLTGATGPQGPTGPTGATGMFSGSETIITALANDDYLFLTDTSDSNNPKRITAGNVLLSSKAVTISWTSNGDAYLVAHEAMTLGSARTRGTGTVAYAKSTDGTTFNSATLPITLAVDDVLKISVTGLSGYKSVTLERSA